MHLGAEAPEDRDQFVGTVVGEVDRGAEPPQRALRQPRRGRAELGRFASLIGTCKMNGVEPCGYLRDLFTRLAGGHLDKDIDVLMPWAHAPASRPSQ